MGFFVLVTTALAISANAKVRSNIAKQREYMRRAIVLARDAEKSGGSPYASVIVDPRKGEIIAEGKNDASINPVLHGEIACINNLSSYAENILHKSVYDIAPDLEFYTTAEPCPMCAGAIIWSGFSTVYYGTSIPYISSQGLAQIDVRATDIAKAATSFRNVHIIGSLLSNETDPLYAKT